MKRRVLQSFLLSATMILLSVPKVAPVMGAEIDETDITVQAGITKMTSELIWEINNSVNLAVEAMNIEMKEIENISDKQEYFVAYKELIDKYSYILDPPETIYDYYSEEELNLLFRVVQAEVGDEHTFEDKCNVASVIFNRINDEKFPDTISKVLKATNQFETISNGSYKKAIVSDTTILACEYVFIFGDTTDGCIGFRSDIAPKKWNKWGYMFTDESGHNFYH